MSLLLDWGFDGALRLVLSSELLPHVSHLGTLEHSARFLGVLLNKAADKDMLHLELVLNVSHCQESPNAYLHFDDEEEITHRECWHTGLFHLCLSGDESLANGHCALLFIRRGDLEGVHVVGVRTKISHLYIKVGLD